MTATTTVLDAVYRADLGGAAWVVDGYGLALRVERGHLVVTDGIGRHRRVRRLSRAQRTVRRIVVLGHTGHLTLEAIRWCADLGIRLVHIDGDGRLLTLAGADGPDDPRLRRAQATADDPTALAITQLLLEAKLMEPLRPIIEAYVLRLVAERTLSRRDFHETTDGNCRLLAPLTHTLAGNATAWASALAPYAEAVAHLIADSTTAPIAKRTPLTQGNKRAVQRRGTKRTPQPTVLAADLPVPTCRHCGGQVATARARLCPDCNAADLPHRAVRQTQARVAKLNSLRTQGEDPTQTVSARAKRSDSLKANRAALHSWHRDDQASLMSREEFTQEIQPALRDLPLSALVDATGLSLSACSRIRSGKLLPHVRHWTRLSELVGRPGSDSGAVSRG